MRITKETQQLFGTDRDVQAYSLLQGEAKTINYQFTQGVSNTPIDITAYVFSAEIIERTADSVTDTPKGISISGLAPKTGANAISLTTGITVTNAATGNLQLYIPASVTSAEPSDPDSVMPVIYTGYLAVNDGGSANPQINKHQFIFLVSNDGVS
jgi:hypothetical protein